MSAWTEKKYHTSAWKVKKFHTTFGRFDTDFTH
jgi:hypothetical protein